MDMPITVPVTDSCIVGAAEKYELPVRLIKAILQVEGGKVGEKRLNKNGSFDLGPMQINTRWLNELHGYVSEEQITNNGCVNVHVGSWILKKNINQAGDFWQGVGNYHSSTFERHEKYKQLVYQAANKID